jgi:hypothetical protein
MTVRPVDSPFTSTTGAYASCLGTNIALPANGVIYVQNVPSTQSASCSGGGNPIGYPVNNDVTEYECRVGDVFLSGTLKGQLTIAAENNIVIVGNTTYATTGTASTDMLGLIAANFVQVYHPVRSNGNDISPTFQDPQIHAAILALNHSLIVQNYNRGSELGTITVNGVIAQKWRGPVGTSGGTGYLKDYNYDSRLRHASPPHALSPFETEFKVNQLAEVKHPPRCTPTPSTPCLPPERSASIRVDAALSDRRGVPRAGAGRRARRAAGGRAPDHRPDRP